MQISERINDQINYVFYRIEEHIPPTTAIKIVGVASIISMLACIYFLVDSTLSLRELTAEMELLMNE